MVRGPRAVESSSRPVRAVPYPLHASRAQPGRAASCRRRCSSAMLASLAPLSLALSLSLSLSLSPLHARAYMPDARSARACTHRHAHRVACALARWNGMRWNDTETMMACTHLRDGDGGGLAASAAAAKNAEPAAMAAAVIAPTSARSAAPAGSAAPVTPPPLRSAAHGDKDNGGEGGGEGAGERAATRDARSRRASARGVRRFDGRRREARERRRHIQTCLLACLLQW